MMVVLLNPASGTVRPGLRSEIDGLFRAAGIDAQVRELAHSGELPAAIRTALDANPEAVIAAGGDGTVSAVAAALAGTPIPLGVLPLGTLNHFAKDAGIPLELPAAVTTVAARQTRRIDVGRVNDRPFINNSSIGVYPSFVQFRERFRARGRSKLTAGGMAMIEVLRRDGEVAIRLHSRGRRIVARTPFVFVGNNEYTVEGFELGARTRLDGGRLHAYFAPPVRTRHLPRLFAHALFGVARREHALESITGAEFWIETLLTRSIHVACDGEVLKFTTPLHYQSWPGALALLAPAG